MRPNHRVRPDYKPTDRRKLVLYADRQKHGWMLRLSGHVPLMISIIALGTSIFSAYQTRLHNRLSATPDIVGARHFGINAKDPPSFLLENKGLGPAKIKDLRIYYEDKQVTDLDEIGYREGEIFKGQLPFWSQPVGSYIVRPGEVYWLYHTRADNIESWEGWRRLVKDKLFVTGVQCSIYNDCSSFCIGKDDDQRACQEIEKELLRPSEGLPGLSEPLNGTFCVDPSCSPLLHTAHFFAFGVP